MTTQSQERYTEEIRLRVTPTQRRLFTQVADSYEFKLGTFLRTVLSRHVPDYTKNRFFG